MYLNLVLVELKKGARIYVDAEKKIGGTQSTAIFQDLAKKTRKRSERIDFWFRDYVCGKRLARDWLSVQNVAYCRRCRAAGAVTLKVFLCSI